MSRASCQFPASEMLDGCGDHHDQSFGFATMETFCFITNGSLRGSNQHLSATSFTGKGTCHVTTACSPATEPTYCRPPAYGTAWHTPLHDTAGRAAKTEGASSGSQEGSMAVTFSA